MKNYSVHEMPKMGDVSTDFEIDEFSSITEDRFEDFFAAPHAHAFYSVIWFRGGGGCHTVDFVKYPLEENTFFFISPGQIHCYDYPIPDGVVITFVPDFLSDSNSTEEIFMKYNIFNAYDMAPCMVVRDENLLRALDNLTHALKVEYGRKEQFGHRTLMQSFVRQMLILLQRNDSPDSRPSFLQSNNVHNHFLRFRQALERDYRRIHNVKGYAAELGVSTKYLTAIVGECTHRTPLQMINDRLLLEAKRLLRYSNMMVKEIAFDLGYEDPSYFVKQFKRQTGQLPTDFREMVSEIS